MSPMLKCVANGGNDPKPEADRFGHKICLPFSGIVADALSYPLYMYIGLQLTGQQDDASDQRSRSGACT